MAWIRRLALVMGTLCGSVGWSSPSVAQEAETAQEAEIQRCVEAYEGAQRLTRDGRLLEAKNNLILCGSGACPQAMHADCQRWLSEVEASIPTVVFQVKTAGGSQPVAPRVSIDGGEPVALNGRAMSLDPGQHRVTFAADRLRATTKSIVLSEGEKLRREVVVLEPIAKDRDVASPDEGSPEATDGSPQEPHPQPKARRTWPLFLSSSVALVGGVGFAYFGIKARTDDLDLKHCTPNCDQGHVDDIKQNYLVANISLGVGAAGLVYTTALVVLRHKNRREQAKARIRVTAHPSAPGLALAGRF